jgi:hypothetical protein
MDERAKASVVERRLAEALGEVVRAPRSSGKTARIE